MTQFHISWCTILSLKTISLKCLIFPKEKLNISVFLFMIMWFLLPMWNRAARKKSTLLHVTAMQPEWVQKGFPAGTGGWRGTGNVEGKLTLKPIVWGVSPSHPLLPCRVTAPAWVMTLTQAETPATRVEHPTSCHPHPLSGKGIHTPLSFEKKKKKPNWCFRKWNLFLGFFHVTESYCLQITLEQPLLSGVHQTTRWTP